jgi:hypothetical protein
MIINNNVIGALFSLEEKIRRQSGGQTGRERVRDHIKPRCIGGKRVGDLTHFLYRYS